MELRRALLGIVACAGSTFAIGCGGSSPPGQTYYERNVEPILLQKCSGTTSGCHRADVDDPYQFAAGNFDVTSFANVQKRRDVLDTFGAYPYPLLLIKAIGPNQLQVQYGSNFPNIAVQHSGGAIIELGSDAFFTLQAWLENGATATGLPPATPAQTGNGVCSDSIPSTFNAATYMTNPAYAAGLATFTSSVQPVLTQHGCVAGSCHGAPQSDFYITCGTTPDELAFNFTQAWSFVNNPVADSQILRVPLAVSAGGRGHTGGDQFASVMDADYLALSTWATSVGVLPFANGDVGRQFFADNVQPILLERGCSFEACHSPTATNDFKLRTGTEGFYSAISLERNYELLKDDFMALEFPDARRGRAVAKTILNDDYRVASVGGMTGQSGAAHRGGPVLETPSSMTPADPGVCPTTYDPTTATAFCTIQQWITIERAPLLTAGTVSSMNDGDPIKLVYVERDTTATAAGRIEFDTYTPGSDLKVATTAFTGIYQQLKPADAGTATSLLGGCPGFTSTATTDVQAPDVAPDGVSVTFAMRTSASDPLGVYVVNVDGTGCKRLTPAAPAVGGVAIHNFDPAWSPDGLSILFASTRGKNGPTLSRKRFLPQSDLWRMNVDGSSPEQVTVLSNSEVSPQFMREGRITMTTEKVSDGFYQLSGRRLNWDLTDYHPLLGQRELSLYADLTNLTLMNPSIGYGAVTDIREGNDGNFMMILSDLDPTTGKSVLPGGAGALATFNRSIGPFEQGRTDAGFLQSVHIIDGATAANGRSGATAGYRAPFYLPDGTIMASYASNVASGNWDIVSVDPRTGNRTALFSGANGKARVDAVLAYKYPLRAMFDNRRQLVFGGSVDPTDTTHAVLHMPDAPMVFTVLMANLRRGRPVDAFRPAKYLAVYSEGMTPQGTTAGNDNGIYQMRVLLGEAQLASDGSVLTRLPAQTGLVFELRDASHNPIVTMAEEHQLGPGEHISMGVQQPLFNAICGGCHGSVSGVELDIAVTPDALTGASASMSATTTPATIGP